MDASRLSPNDILGVVEDALLDSETPGYVRMSAAKILLEAHNNAAEADPTDAARLFVEGLTDADAEPDGD